MLDSAWLFPVIPAVSFLVILFFGKKLPFKGAEVGIASVGAMFLLACVVAAQWIDKVESAGHGSEKGLAALGHSVVAAAEGAKGGGEVEPIVHGFTWWQNGAAKFVVGTRVDGLVVMMLLVVTTISLLVHIYSTAYMHDDRRYTYYYAALSLFTASMLLLVVSANLLQLLVGWELVGLCSFMLIGHWWEEKENSNAALKAFLTTRTGDVGLMIGIIVCFFAANSFDIAKVNAYALSPGADHGLLLVAAVALMFGIMGKSGQFFLHTWLPDAMAGPTPVSALIHAATMVVAGVYLGARVYPVFFNGFSIGTSTFNMMAIVGAVTILIGAALAFVQHDIKKVLAYSTISQLGYMVMALGVGAWSAALFHLFTHAFFKACLFLGAGSISHSATHHSFDMREMGGLRKKMPVTFWTFMIATLALAGIFPFAGFWSKDEILATAGQGRYDVFVVVGLVGAVMTAAYMTRCVYLTFFGKYRGHHHPHESSPAITVPLVVLAVLSLLAGLLQAAPINVTKFEHWLEPVGGLPELVHPKFDYALATISVALASLAVGAAFFFLFKREESGAFKGLTQRSKVAHAGYTFLEKKYYLDDLYEGVIVAGIKGPIARASYWMNQNVIDGVVNAVGRGTTRAGRFTYGVLDQELVDGAVNDLGRETGSAGGGMTKLQSGQLQRYALLLLASVGLIGLAVYLVNVV
ncbi:MAG: NADH-quinone oxidoreductase subunit L [Acidimicrobiia bacterium]|jgi:NADH-quinone oxidoreductase subunit L